MEAVTQFEQTLNAAADKIKTVLQDYQGVIKTDKQPEFEVSSTFDLVQQIIEGLNVETTLKINKLIQTIKKVALSDFNTIVQPQDQKQKER